MRLLFQIVAFWLVVVIAVRVAVCFPRSLLARVLFYDLGPLRRRGEREVDFRLRRAGHSVSWFAQAALLFTAGWLLLRWNTALVDAAPFLVLWAIIVPLIGTGALVAALVDLGRVVLLRRRERTRTTLSVGGAHP
jgi:hypothetical protein